MKTKWLALLAILLAGGSTAAYAIETGFTYQGRLNDGSNEANGLYDFQFAVWTGASSTNFGFQLGTNLVVNAVGVTNGLFTVILDFGADTFVPTRIPGDFGLRWLEIGVRPHQGILPERFTLLAPRQLITSTPYAIYADIADSLTAAATANLVHKSGDTITGPFKINNDGGAALSASTASSTEAAVVGRSTALDGDGLAGQADWGTAAQGVSGTSGDGYGGYFRGGNCGIYAYSPTGQGRDGGYAGSFEGNVAISANFSGAPDKPQLEIKDNETTGIARLRLNLMSPTQPLFWDVANRNGDGYNALRFFNNAANADVMTLRTNGELSVRVLTITGGADVAEPFEMSGQNLTKGAVVVIDPDRPGQLKLSENAYDTRVAGVISGGKGIQPGLSLRQEGALEGGRNVALSGRVYVQADASGGAIQPGDLLTTSDTPGHAMKVLNFTRAQGAILGKAMSALEKEKGWVLVLVTLQ